MHVIIHWKIYLQLDFETQCIYNIGLLFTNSLLKGLRGKNSVQVFHTDVRDPGTWAIICCLSVCVWGRNCNRAEPATQSTAEHGPLATMTTAEHSPLAIMTTAERGPFATITTVERGPSASVPNVCPNSHISGPNTCHFHHVSKHQWQSLNLKLLAWPENSKWPDCTSLHSVLFSPGPAIMASQEFLCHVKLTPTSLIFPANILPVAWVLTTLKSLKCCLILISHFLTYVQILVVTLPQC